jgi:NADH:ubiquinone oxidoreductase subunit 4 (subunit M)
MTYPGVLLAALFLPLFPFSMVFNALYMRVRHPLVRGLLLLVWPQAGLAIVSTVDGYVPNWILAWALFTSLLYALRALALRELGLWTSFIATSSWALLWILWANGVDTFQLKSLSLAISVPLVLMAGLSAGLERRFGAAYLGLYGGLAQSVPRFTGVLVMVVLAIVATPLFPGFFAMLSMLIKSTPATPLISLGIGIVWLLWSWAGARLLQGLIIGPQHNAVADLSTATMWVYIAILLGLTVTSVFSLGLMP